MRNKEIKDQVESIGLSVACFKISHTYYLFEKKDIIYLKKKDINKCVKKIQLSRQSLVLFDIFRKSFNSNVHSGRHTRTNPGGTSSTVLRNPMGKTIGDM